MSIWKRSTNKYSFIKGYSQLSRNSRKQYKAANSKIQECLWLKNIRIVDAHKFIDKYAFHKKKCENRLKSSPF